VAELTGLLDLTGWPKGMRVIARKERPHPGTQLRITDTDSMRVTAFATNTARGGQLADLELRHRRRRARAEDRIRGAKDTGLTNLPLHDFDQNRIWCALVSLAWELTAWLQTSPWPGTRPALGAQTAPATAVLRRRTTRRLQSPHRAAPASHRCVERPTLRHAAPATRPPRPQRLTTRPVPTTLATPRPVEPAPHRATSERLSHRSPRINQQPAPDTTRQAATANS
jgi:hypothetical protein